MLTVKELKEKLKDVPDHYEIIFDVCQVGDTYNSLAVNDVYIDKKSELVELSN